MKKMIHPKLSAYVIPGVVAVALVIGLLTALTAAADKRPALLLLAFVVAAYAFWCWVLRGHALLVTEKGLALRHRLAKTVELRWSDIARTEIPYLTGRPPLQALVWSRISAPPVMTLPLRLYALEDVRFLLGLTRLHWGNEDSTSDLRGSWAAHHEDMALAKSA